MTLRFRSFQTILKAGNLLLLIFALLPGKISAQGYLHADGKYICDAQGNDIILRGIGAGNWMIQEGYMMKSTGPANTQHEFEKKLAEIIGQQKTDSFYNFWLTHHLTRGDIDSMKSWGFNSIRPAMHYKWFTPPIEEEPVAGEITWIDRGFILIDSLLKWCSKNEMYLILDMHGAPGGQGKDASISDYDPVKPSLWESRENKDKLIALWKKLATRYSNEPWIGGYDLINEPNWDFENSGNKNGCNCVENIPLLELFEELIDAIREVDRNHIIFIEGNCWANNYKGLYPLASYDENIVFSFHKYWNWNNQESIAWITALRDSLNIPIWLGESGENSNTWYTNAIRLCEKNRIGWSWWPLKKNGVNNVMMVHANPEYLELMDYWRGKASRPMDEEAFHAVMTWAENHQNKHCKIQYDVIDAMIRQPYTTETLAFKSHRTGDIIFATDYDLGRNQYAYFDTDTGNYRVSTGKGTPWNRGRSYRNDGVDIIPCSDTAISNGYCVGWTENEEWMNYSLNSDRKITYIVNIRYASPEKEGKIHFESNGDSLTEPISLPKTGGKQNWTTLQVHGVNLPKGKVSIRLVIDEGGMNINYFSFTDPHND